MTGNESGSETSTPYVYREKRKRYPWWVRTVEGTTTEIDLEATAQPARGGIDAMLEDLVGTEKREAVAKNGVEYLKKGIEQEAPGRTLRDVALHYSLGTYFTRSIHLDSYKRHNRAVWDGLSEYVLTPEQLSVPRWQGPEQDASDMLEQAAVHFGAAQMGFARVETHWLWAGVRLDPAANEPADAGSGGAKEMVIPGRFRYVVLTVVPVPAELGRRAPSELGNAGDRSAWARKEMTELMLINFIVGLGYEAIPLPGPYVPFALMAGLGEMGRTNRLVSPVLGANIRLGAVLTDLPVALDRPIDFGLQEFCKRCRKCAEACPVTALSSDEEPSWEPQGSWSVPGKKVYFENSLACRSHLLGHATFCAACMAACPWTKPYTALHRLGRTVAAKAPKSAGVMAKLDDALGFGLAPQSSAIESWWRSIVPPWGIDTNRWRR